MTLIDSVTMVKFLGVTGCVCKINDVISVSVSRNVFYIIFDRS